MHKAKATALGTRHPALAGRLGTTRKSQSQTAIVVSFAIKERQLLPNHQTRLSSAGSGGERAEGRAEGGAAAAAACKCLKGEAVADRTRSLHVQSFHLNRLQVLK